MTADRFQELCEEFLLSGLEGEELRVFREELERRGADGDAVLDRTRKTMGLLALSASPVDPPKELRERLMAEVSHAHLPATEERPGWVRRVLLAAAIVSAVVLGVWNLSLHSDLSETTAALEEAQQELQAVDTLRQELATLREDLGTIVSPSGSMFNLAGTETRPDARARVFVDPQTGRALVLAYELPILAAESVYQLWAIRDGEPFSVGTFTASDEGPARLELDSLDPVAGADLLAVTIEPAPGQTAPTGEMVLVSGQ